MASRSKEYRGRMTGLSFFRRLRDRIINPILANRVVGQVGHDLGSLIRSRAFKAPLFYVRRIWSVTFIERARLLGKKIEQKSPERQAQVSAATDLKLLGPKKVRSEIRLKDAEKKKEASEKVWTGIAHRQFLKGWLYPAVLIAVGIIGAAFDLTLFGGLTANYAALVAICLFVAFAQTGAPHLIGSLPKRHTGFIDVYSEKNPPEEGRNYNPKFTKIERVSYLAVLATAMMVALFAPIIRTFEFYTSDLMMEVWNHQPPASIWVFFVFFSIGAFQLAFVTLLSIKKHDPEVFAFEARLKKATRDFEIAESEDTDVEQQIAHAFKAYNLAEDRMESIEERFEQFIEEMMYNGHCLEDLFGTCYAAAHQEDDALDIPKQPPQITIPATPKKQKFQVNIPQVESLLGIKRRERVALEQMDEQETQSYVIEHSGGGNGDGEEADHKRPGGSTK